MKVSTLLEPLIGIIDPDRPARRRSHDAIWVRDSRETAAGLPTLRADEIIRAKVEICSAVLESSVDIDSALDALLMEL